MIREIRLKLVDPYLYFILCIIISALDIYFEKLVAYVIRNRQKCFLLDGCKLVSLSSHLDGLVLFLSRITSYRTSSVPYLHDVCVCIALSFKLFKRVDILLAKLHS